MEPVKVESGIAAIYQYIPSEPIVLSPHIEITEDPKQQEINNLREFTTKQNDVIKKLIDKQDTLEKTIIDQNNLLQEIINRLKK